MSVTSNIAKAVRRLPFRLRVLAWQSRWTIAELHETIDEATDVAIDVAIFHVIQESGLGNLRQLLKLFVQGRFGATSTHYGPMVTDHAAAAGALLGKLIDRGVLTCNGQERQFDDPGTKQRAYLCGSFVLGEDASFDDAVAMLASTGSCFTAVTADRDRAMLGLRGVDGQWSGEVVWVTMCAGEPTTQIMDAENYVHEYDVYGMAKHVDAARVLSFHIWDPTWPERDELDGPVLEERLLRALDDPRFRGVVAKI